MTQEQFIKEVAKYVQKYAPQYGIKVYSPIIAQFCLESNYGTSNKVKKILENGTVDWRHNYAGLKWRDKRCAISNDYFIEGTAEQLKDASYINIASKFYRFKSLEDCVIGYFQFTNISAYKNLKGVTDPEQYLINIKADKYASEIDYVQRNMNVIRKCNLTKYDPVNAESTTPNKGGKKMKINVHAGHNPDGRIACGAVGFIRESTEARNVKDKVIEMLRTQGHEVYDCTVDNGTSANDVLKKIVAKCNSRTVDLDISIHFNSGSSKTRDGKTTGTEVYVYSSNSKAKSSAQKIVTSIASLGFKNRGVKYSKSLYFLRKTNNPALLIECCFVSDPEDCDIYNADKMAQAIVKGITGMIPTITTSQSSASNQSSTTVASTNSKKKQTIKEGQVHANNFAQCGLKPDGVRGSLTRKGAIKVLQRAMNLDYNVKLPEDGTWDAACEKALGNHYVKLGESQYMVTALEIMLMLKGYDCVVELPGIFGNGLKASVIAYQRDNKLSQTGIANVAVFKSLIE